MRVELPDVSMDALKQETVESLIRKGVATCHAYDALIKAEPDKKAQLMGELKLHIGVAQLRLDLLRGMLDLAKTAIS